MSEITKSELLEENTMENMEPGENLDSKMDDTPKESKKIEKTKGKKQNTIKLTQDELDKLIQEKIKQKANDDAGMLHDKQLERFMVNTRFTNKEAAAHVMKVVGPEHHRFAKLFDDLAINYTRNQIWDIVGTSKVDDEEYARANKKA